MDVRKGDRCGIAGFDSGTGVMDRELCSLGEPVVDTLDDFRRKGRTGRASFSGSDGGVSLRGGEDDNSGIRRRGSAIISRRGERDCGTGEAERVRLVGDIGKLFGDNSSE
jgi:hypothetical protein